MENLNDHPTLEGLRHEAIAAGAIDPLTLMFRVEEYDKYSGELLSVPMQNIGLPEAIERTAHLIELRADSHFLVHPVGFIH